MQEIEEAGAKIDVCTSCRGTFLDANEGNSFVDDVQKLADALASPLIDAQTGHPCPRCGAVTNEGGLFDPQYRIELCESCGGMWLVSRQLSRLRKIVADGVPAPMGDKKRKATQTSPAAPSQVVPSVPSKKKVGVAKAEVPVHRCPKCHAAATRWDRWSCTCGMVWDAFTTQGVCPKCDQRWDNTRCPRCGHSSPHAAWYAKR
jgi:Zn-finger nucleic acid-binding protein